MKQLGCMHAIHTVMMVKGPHYYDFSGEAKRDLLVLFPGVCNGEEYTSWH